MIEESELVFKHKHKSLQQTKQAYPKKPLCMYLYLKFFLPDTINLLVKKWIMIYGLHVHVTECQHKYTQMSYKHVVKFY